MGLAPAISNFFAGRSLRGPRTHNQHSKQHVGCLCSLCAVHAHALELPMHACTRPAIYVPSHIRGMPVHAHTCALLRNMRMLPRSTHETMHEYVPSPLRSHCRFELILISFSSTRLPQSKSWSPFRRPPTAAAMAANAVPPQPRQIMYEWDLLGTYLGGRSKSQGFTSMILWYT